MNNLCYYLGLCEPSDYKRLFVLTAILVGIFVLFYLAEVWTKKRNASDEHWTTTEKGVPNTSVAYGPPTVLREEANLKELTLYDLIKARGTTVHKFLVNVSKREGKKKEMSIAQIKECGKAINDELKER